MAARAKSTTFSSSSSNPTGSVRHDEEFDSLNLTTSMATVTTTTTTSQPLAMKISTQWGSDEMIEQQMATLHGSSEEGFVIFEHCEDQDHEDEEEFTVAAVLADARAMDSLKGDKFVRSLPAESSPEPPSTSPIFANREISEGREDCVEAAKSELSSVCCENSKDSTNEASLEGPKRLANKVVASLIPSEASKQQRKRESFGETPSISIESDIASSRSSRLSSLTEVNETKQFSKNSGKLQQRTNESSVEELRRSALQLAKSMFSDEESQQHTNEQAFDEQAFEALQRLAVEIALRSSVLSQSSLPSTGSYEVNENRDPFLKKMNEIDQSTGNRMDLNPTKNVEPDPNLSTGSGELSRAVTVSSPISLQCPRPTSGNMSRQRTYPGADRIVRLNRLPSSRTSLSTFSSQNFNSRQRRRSSAVRGSWFNSSSSFMSSLRTRLSRDVNTERSSPGAVRVRGFRSSSFMTSFCTTTSRLSDLSLLPIAEFEKVVQARLVEDASNRELGQGEPVIIATLLDSALLDSTDDVSHDTTRLIMILSVMMVFCIGLGIGIWIGRIM